MARSKGGKLLGKAAQTQHRELMESIEDGVSLPRQDDEQKLLASIAHEEEFIEKYSEGYSSLCEEARSRIRFYQDALKVAQDSKAEESALAHIDSLVGEERATAMQMIDVTEVIQNTVDLTDKFNCGHKVTASREWVRRHL